jgi:hypothetical protein
MSNESRITDYGSPITHNRLHITDYPRVSIIILNWNGWKDTIEFLESLYQITYSNYHVIEHLPRHDSPKALKAWYGLLTHEGKLIIECPDFDDAVKDYIEGNEESIDNIFGLQRFPGDAHLFGYNFKRLEKLLEAVGFKDIQKREPQDPHIKDEPCLRVECVKGDKP